MRLVEPITRICPATSAAALLSGAVPISAFHVSSPISVLGNPQESQDEGVKPPVLVTGTSRYVYVRQHMEYQACGPSRETLPTKPCQPAPSAHDHRGNDISAFVYTLPASMDPSVCVQIGCTGFEFALVGLRFAALDTSLEPGTELTFKLVAVDDQGRVATAVQTIFIIPPCSKGLNWCQGRCYAVDCAVAERFSFMLAERNSLELVGPKELVVPYGMPFPGISPTSLVPCSDSVQAEEGRCGAFLTNPEAQASRISAVQVPPEGCWSSIRGVQCPRCDPAMVLGTGPGWCLPGEYKFLYAAFTADGEQMEQQRTVVIEHGGVLRLVVEFLATNLEDDGQGLSRNEWVSRLLDTESQEGAAARLQVLNLMNAGLSIAQEQPIGPSAAHIVQVAFEGGAAQVTLHVVVPKRLQGVVEEIVQAQMADLQRSRRALQDASNSESAIYLHRLRTTSLSPAVDVDLSEGQWASLASSFLGFQSSADLGTDHNVATAARAARSDVASSLSIQGKGLEKSVQQYMTEAMKLNTMLMVRTP